MKIDSIARGVPLGVALSDFVDSAPPRSARRGVRRSPRRVGFVALAACLIVGWALFHGGDRGPVSSGPSNSSLAVFATDARLPALISFSATEAFRAGGQYQSRSRTGTQERWDTLTMGGVEAGDPLFRVTVKSIKSGSVRSSLFVDLAMQSAEIGAAVVHATNPEIYLAERGPIEWAAVTLADPKQERPCLGFRFVRAEDFAISGLACGAHASPVDLPELERLIDRLSPTNSGAQAGLGAVFKGGAT
jgi:hypothetical protein